MLHFVGKYVSTFFILKYIKQKQLQCYPRKFRLYSVKATEQKLNPKLPERINPGKSPLWPIL